MSTPNPRTPVGSPDERLLQKTTDPVQMSLAEKLLCEEEARHDVRARGRGVDASPVQHYLTHARCEDLCHPSAAKQPRSPHTPEAADKRAAKVSPAVSEWLRWGEEGRPDTPVIPRC